MGLFVSKSDITLNAELLELKNRINSLESVDTNGDGVISRSEFDQMMKQQDSYMKALKEKIESQAEEKYLKDLMNREREVNDAKKEISELRKELDSLKSINNTLEHKLTFNSDQYTNDTNINIDIDKKEYEFKDVSKDRINAFVETLLQNKDINIKYLPDAVERQIYRNVFSILLGLMDNLFESTSVKFIGHKLTFSLQPMSDQEIIENNQEKEQEQEKNNDKIKDKIKEKDKNKDKHKSKK